MENRATLFVLKSEGKYVSGVTPLGVLTTSDELARAAFLCERDVNHLDKVFDGCTVVRVECVLREFKVREATLEELEAEAKAALDAEYNLSTLSSGTLSAMSLEQ